MSESKLQAKIIKHYQDKGYFVLKLIKTNKNGIPDLLCMKKGDVFFIEVKFGKNKPSKLQLYRMDELKDYGFKSLVLYDLPTF